MITLLTPLRLYAWLYPQREVLVTEEDRLTSKDLYLQARRMVVLLHHNYGLKPGQTVGVLCRNHLVSVLLLPALMRLGVNIRLLNTDMVATQVTSLVEGHCSLLIYDQEIQTRCISLSMSCRLVTTEELRHQLFSSEDTCNESLPWCHKRASLSVFTGGTSGAFKEAERSARALPFLAPFLALMRQVGLWRYRSVLITLPLYHGFGLSALIVSLFLGKKVCLLRHFQSQRVLAMIRQEQIQVLPVVPALLSRLWHVSEASDALRSVRCILCGGDHLSLSLIQHTQQQLGHILYNLYGTSEAGFFILAQPNQLARATKEGLLGNPIPGVQCDVRDQDDQGVGTLWVRSAWAMVGRQNRWQNTGDLVSRDVDGNYYHHGRVDRMVVCGGENVYLDHVEHILLTHPAIANVRVYPVEHPDFGKVLHARIELSNVSESVNKIEAEDLRLWLSTRLSRAEMPHAFVFGPLELLSTGKIGVQTD